MEIFYNASHLWTSTHYKLYYARNIIMTGGINYLILNRFPEGRIDWLYVARNKIQSAAMFNATFFLLSCKHMLEWLQMMKLAAGQSDHQCFSLSLSRLLKSLPNNRILQIVGDLCQGFAGKHRGQQQPLLLAHGMCEYAKLPLLFSSSFLFFLMQGFNMKT